MSLLLTKAHNSTSSQQRTLSIRKASMPVSYNNDFQPQRRIRSRRKSSTTTTTLILILVTSTPAFFSSPSAHAFMPASTTLYARSHTVRESSLDMVGPSRREPVLSAEEELDLLRQATELRRLQKLEADLAKQTPDLKVPLLSVRAKAAGYGDELDAYERAKDVGHKARETLVTRNMGLVDFCVKNVLQQRPVSASSSSISREDLIQEGAIGLARAVDRYNIGIGGKFSTYAVYWVRAAILRCIAEKDDVMRVPEHVSHAVTKMTKAAERLGVELDGTALLESVFSPSWKEANDAKALAEEAGLTNFQLREALRVRRRRKGGYITYESWMTDRSADGNMNSKDSRTTTTSNNGKLSSNTLDADQIKDIISRFLQPKEMEALSLRYGLNDDNDDNNELDGPQQAPVRLVTKGKQGEAMSFKEVGKHMSISTEYGRKLCRKALDKLQQAVAEGRLEPALLM